MLLVVGVNWLALELGRWIRQRWQGLRQEVEPGRLRAGMVAVGGSTVPATRWGQPLSPADIAALRERATQPKDRGSVVEVAASLRWAPALVGGAALTAILGGTVVNTARPGNDATPRPAWGPPWTRSRSRTAGSCLHYYECCSCERIARLEDRSYATIRWRLRRARDGLRAELRRRTGSGAPVV